MSELDVIRKENKTLKRDNHLQTKQLDRYEKDGQLSVCD